MGINGKINRNGENTVFGKVLDTQITTRHHLQLLNSHLKVWGKSASGQRKQLGRCHSGIFSLGK